MNTEQTSKNIFMCKINCLYYYSKRHYKIQLSFSKIFRKCYKLDQNFLNEITDSSFLGTDLHNYELK